MPMKLMLKMICYSVVLFAFFGCNQQPMNYVELMKHPAELKEEAANCQMNAGPHCAEVKRAAQDYYTLNNERQDNPEAFGLKILLAQQALAKTKAKGDQKEYESQLEQVNAMLAVVSATSPE